jgi:RNA polymerase sigma-70 factor (ECF subfamily)
MRTRHEGDGEGEPFLFDDFYRAIYPEGVKFAIAAYFPKDRWTAEDVVQEVMVNMCKNWEDIPAPPGQRTRYFYRSVRNRAISQVERRSREVPMETWLEGASRPSDEQFGDLHVREAMGRLPDKEREAAALVFIVGMTNAQAAAVIGVSVRTVGLRLAVARRKLRGWLLNDEPGRRRACHAVTA